MEANKLPEIINKISIGENEFFWDDLTEQDKKTVAELIQENCMTLIGFKRTA